MKRGNAVEVKLSSQRMNYVRGLHYDDVDRVAKNKIETEKRQKRLDIILKMKIRKNKGLEMPGGIKIPIKFIKSDGLIVLDNLDEIDVLLIYP